MKNKDCSQYIAEDIGEFIYRIFPEHKDEILEELKSITSLLYVLIIISIIGLFV